LTSQVRLPLVFRPMNDPGNDSEVVSSLLSGDPADPSPAVVPVNEATVAGYSLVRDLNGEPVAVLGLGMPRDTYRAGLAAVRYLMFGILAALVVFGGGFLLFTDRRVLARTARLASSVTEIGRNQDPVARVTVEGRDELGGLAATTACSGRSRSPAPRSSVARSTITPCSSHRVIRSTSRRTTATLWT
jgi:HAMP domain-containing protein